MNSQALRSRQAEGVPVWTVADRLRKAREHAGLEQNELADVTGISRATISNYERGKYEPSRASLNLWALATGVPSEWLRDGALYTPRDLNPEPTDSESGNVTPIDWARSLREPLPMSGDAA